MNLITLILVIIGGIDWLLIGAFTFNLGGAVLPGGMTLASRAVTVIVGLCALWRTMPSLRLFSIDESAAELGR